ncbi:thioredoxin reductase (NADPH) [Dethiosulfatibacter aminovorans DSM 17477]|uniref:Thioredoxin reductase n=1 Tax=Dethiosulfatibacter aminovorans DSM 17477 TaxID=1121476 RepID=A0A1M6FCJ5_9FIRM|nr:thioredoxin-disulfide reductase [Dethiosulfatibacter aminovorans]SHI95392.1 thioredoxin reductase (NADPH) [Dethiosulfatibacter aminovorans DSM 17477]
MEDKIYDVIILGGGPAGLAAGLYAGRARLDTLMIEKEKEGGLIVQTEEVENYPGAIEGDTGISLTQRMVEQVDKFLANRLIDTITEVDLESDIKVLKGQKGEYRAKTVIVATGAKPKLMGCPGESDFIGKGVSYCATCDGAFFEGFDVYVVGGGDSAVEEAIFLTRFAKKVHIIHRRDELRAAKSIQEKAFANEKIDFIWNSQVEEVKGTGLVNSMVIKNRKTGEITEIKADENDGIFGIFVFIGYNPITELFEGKLDMKDNYLVTNENMETNIPGVFAAGDVRDKMLRQVVTATSDGAIAAVSAERYIECKEFGC